MLGHGAVMLEHVVGQAGNARQKGGIGGGDAVDSQRVEGGHGVIPAFCRGIEALFVVAAHACQHGHFRPAKAALGQEAGNLGGGVFAGGQDQEPRVGLDEGDHLFDRAAMHGERFEIGHRPTHADRRELKGADLWMICDLAWGRCCGRCGRRPRTTRDRRWPARRRGLPLSEVSVSIRASKGEGQDRRSAVMAPERSWWRSPPMMISAASRMARVAGLSPSSPSSPMPTMWSQGLVIERLAFSICVFQGQTHGKFGVIQRDFSANCREGRSLGALAAFRWGFPPFRYLRQHRTCGHAAGHFFVHRSTSICRLVPRVRQRHCGHPDRRLPTSKRGRCSTQRVLQALEGHNRGK